MDAKATVTDLVRARPDIEEKIAEVLNRDPSTVTVLLTPFILNHKNQVIVEVKLDGKEPVGKEANILHLLFTSTGGQKMASA